MLPTRKEVKMKKTNLKVGDYVYTVGYNCLIRETVKSFTHKNGEEMVVTNEGHTYKKNEVYINECDAQFLLDFKRIIREENVRLFGKGNK